MVYAPLAGIFGWTIPKGLIGVCVVGWVWATIISVSLLWNFHGNKIKQRLGARRARKLSLIEQRIKDGKEGICTIVEVI